MMMTGWEASLSLHNMIMMMVMMMIMMLMTGWEASLSLHKPKTEAPPHPPLHG